MQTTRPTTGAWDPTAILKPIPLQTRNISGGSEIAFFSPEMLGADPYDYVGSGGPVGVFTPLLDCTGYHQLCWVWSKQLFTGGAQTIEMICHSCMPVPVSGPASGEPYQVSDEGTGALALGAMPGNYFQRRCFPSGTGNTTLWPPGYTYFSATIGGGMPTACQMWFSLILWNPGFRS